MSWESYHRRRALVREALVYAAETAESAEQIIDAFDPDGAVFESGTDFLLDVQMAWFQNLSGELDRSRHLGSSDLSILTARAWAQTAADMPGARRLLDAERDNGGLTRAFAKEDALLAVSAGGDSPAHAAHIRESAAKLHVAPRNQRTTRTGLFTRLREALAA